MRNNLSVIKVKEKERLIYALNGKKYTLVSKCYMFWFNLQNETNFGLSYFKTFHKLTELHSSDCQ